MSTDAPALGWLGTGRMGTVMASRLMDAGDRLTVWNRTHAKTAPLAARGAAVAASITDLGSCDVVFVMVATPPDVEEVVMGHRGLLSGERKPGVIVDCSTVSAQTSARVRAAATAAGAGFIAAPVSGNPQASAASSLPAHTRRSSRSGRIWTRFQRSPCTPGRRNRRGW